MSLGPDPEKLAAFEADIAARQQAAAERKRSRKQEEETEGVSRAALNMRKRRQRPDVKAREAKAIAARDAARIILAKNHPEEFTALVQIERKRLGLPPLQPRGANARRAAAAEHKEAEAHTPQRPAPVNVQSTCRHSDYPMNKQTYGKFCGNCGVRIP